MALSIVALLFSHAAEAQTTRNLARPFPLWGGLSPGPHAVGYQAGYYFDHSRVLTPARDFRGHPNGGERDRPLLVRIWYPARPRQGARLMPYGEYLSVPAAGVPPNVSEGLHRRTLDIHNYAAGKYAPGSAEGLFERLRTLPTAVNAGARPAPGRFPVVVYSAGAYNSTEENTVLWEYLASHGYVVAAVPSMGAHTVRSTVDAAGLEAQARDMEFLVEHLHGFAPADLDRLCAMGFSFGGAAALVVAMRNPDVDAVVGFDSSFIAKRFVPVIRNSPAFDVERLSVPLLEFHRRDADTVSYELTDSLRYTPRHSFDIAGLNHLDFNSYSLLYGTASGAAPSPDLAARQTAYEEMVRYTRDFLDVHLKGSRAEASLKTPAAWRGYGDGDVLFRFKEALPAPPTGTDLLALIREEGVERGEKLYEGLRRNDPSASVLAESVIDGVAFSLLGEGRAAEALRVFRWNAEAYPNSASAFYGLGEAYKKLGQTACAARAYRKALEILPADSTTSASDKETVRRDAEEYLKKSGAATADSGCDASVLR